MAKKILNKITKLDIENAIFIPKKNKDGVPSKEDGVVIYALSGSGDIKDTNGFDILLDRQKRNNSDQIVKDLAETRKTACAKTITINGKTRFFIKQGRQGHFYNPLAPIPTDNRDYVRSHGREEWIYREVNKKVFDYYSLFLKTKNSRHLVDAERESV